MTNYLSFFLILIATIIFSACSAKAPAAMDKVISSVTKQETKPEVSPASELPFIATFEIYTNGTKRIFTQAMYHEQSNDVYIQADDPSLVHVSAANITWDAFFKTLPFTVTKECLITGTNQTFCTSSTHQLVFILNGEPDADALDRQISKDDKLVIEYEKK